MNKSENNKNNSSAEINVIWVVIFVACVLLIVVGFYFFHFNKNLEISPNWKVIFDNLSQNTGDWGTFGDYVGGILNPIIAIFILYYAANAYVVQKNELKTTSKALRDQVELSALTSFININLTRIDLYRKQKVEILSIYSNEDIKILLDAVHKSKVSNKSEDEKQHSEAFFEGFYGKEFANNKNKIEDIDKKIQDLSGINEQLENKINLILRRWDS